MKKIFTLLAALLVGGAVASADDVVFIGETGYATLNEALAGATDGAVIEIKGDLVMTANDRVSINQESKNDLTIQAADGVTITYTGKNNRAFTVDKSVKFKNLNIVYSGDASNQPLIQASTKNTILTLENCIISNYKGTNQRAVIAKSSGKVYLMNVKFSNNSSETVQGDVFIGQSGSTIDGTTNATVYVEKDLYMVAGPDFAPESPITVYIDDNYANRNGKNVITNTRDLKKFKLVSEKYALTANGNNLKAAPHIANIERTGIKYATLAEAVDCAENNDVINLTSDVTVSDRIGLNKKITILGTEGVNVNFARTDKAAFLANEGEVATLKNLNLVYANTNASGSINPSESKFLEANKGGMIVEDCVIKNFETSNNQGVIAAINGGRFTLKNVTLENCKVPENRGEIFFGANNSVVDGTTNGSIFVEKSYTFKADSSFDPAPRVAAEALDADVVPAANTVKVYTDAHTIGSPVIEGTADPAKFELNNTAWELEAKDGKLVIKEKQSVGIAGVEADENAPVEYFNLNGVQVKADNMTPGVYVRRQGKNVTKVMVK